MDDEEMSIAFRRFLVMGAGFVTVIGTLVLAGTTGLIDLLYSYDVIAVSLPTGAFALGVLAGSGFGIAGWFLTRLRFTTHMLATVVVAMVVAYAALVVIEYSENAPAQMGFFEYFDTSTRLATISTPTKFGQPATIPEPLGGDGYSYRFLELFGLTFGGVGALLLVPAMRRRAGIRDYG